MINTHCDKCHLAIYIKNTQKSYDSSKHYIICKYCLKKTKYFSKAELKKKLLLNNSDFNDCKYLFIKNSNIKYFTHSDIKKIIVNKYESIDNFKKILKERKNKKINNLDRKEKDKEIRKTKIINAFIENKLDFKNYGDNYLYINFGKPSIESIILKEIEKNKEKNKRRYILAQELSKVNIVLDESLDSVYNYINSIGYKNLQESVRSVEIEFFLKNYTNYEELVKIYGKEIAEEYAVKSYINNDINNNIHKKDIDKKIIISFD